MTRHLLLLRASGNRVFGASATALAQAEMEVLARRCLDVALSPAGPVTVGGVDYLEVETDGPLDGAALAVLSNLSSLHALFEVEGDLLRPRAVAPRRLLDEDLTTIQRYVGKTNEAFTHLLVNLALAAGTGTFARLLAGERLVLLDPVCGRGTTLHRAALYGLDAHGIELDRRAVEAYDTFFVTWLKDKRLKHQVERATLRKGRSTPAHRVAITYGEKGAEQHRRVEVVNDDTLRAAEHLRPRSVDALACDLPYGVQHGADSGGGRARGPGDLLERALPVWRELLRPGAGVAMAWNRRTLSRERLVALVAEAGFELDEVGPDAFRHRVDRTIDRDVVVARRPGG
ncbi:MAG: TRM11 family SAM-dependent methyltransferase [Acidimicrobiales bacterium]